MKNSLKKLKVDDDKFIEELQPDYFNEPKQPERITREEAKTNLSKAYNNFVCKCSDKGHCTHQSNPFGLQNELDKLFDYIEHLEDNKKDNQ